MNHPARNPLEEIEWFGQNGFDFVDFTLEPPAADPGLIEPSAVRAALKRYGLGVVAHTAYFIPYGLPFAGVREAGLEEFRRALTVASQIGATAMNTHYSKAPPFFSPEQVIGWHVEVLMQVAQTNEAIGQQRNETTLSGAKGGRAALLLLVFQPWWQNDHDPGETTWGTIGSENQARKSLWHWSFCWSQLSTC